MRDVLWLVPAFVAVRLILLYWGTDAVYFDEELATGLIGLHLIEGLHLPLLGYQIAGHLGGTLLVGVLAAPSFLLLGTHLLALKLVPVTLQAVTLVLWYLCVHRFGGRFAAIAVAGLLVVPPQLLTRFSVVAVGFHPETLLFTAAAALCVFRLTEGTPVRPVWELVFGLVSGLGIWVGYIFLPTLVTSLVYRSIVDRGWLRSRAVRLCALGLVLGAMPWMAFNVTHAFAGLDWFTPVGGRTPIGVSARIVAAVRFLTVDLFHSVAGSLPRLEGVVVASLFCGAAAAGAVSAVVSLRRDRRGAQPLLWFVMYPVVLAGTYGVNLGIGSALGRVEYSSYDGFRYLLPLYPILIVMTACAASRLRFSGTSGRRIAVLILVGLLAAGALSTGRLLSLQNSGRLWEYAAVSYKEFAFQRGDAESLDVQRLSPAERRRHELGRGWVAAQRHLEGQPLPGDEGLPRTTELMVMPTAPGADPDGRLLTCAHRSGSAWRPGGDPECEWYAAAGLGASVRLSAIALADFDTEVPRQTQRVAALAAQAPTRSRRAVFQGFGQGLGATLEHSVLERFDVVLHAIDTFIDGPDTDDVYRGLGRGLAWRFGQDPRRLEDIVERVRIDQRARCEEGILEFENRLALY